MRATSQHTPGPWQVDHGFSSMVVADKFRKTIPVTMPDGEVREHEAGMLALVYAPGGWGPLTSEANARLIAAAPDMYDVCVEAENWLDNHGDETDPGAMGLLSMLRAAITKAEGR